MPHPSIDSELLPKFEVLEDLESTVRELIRKHEASRNLWYPSDLIGDEEQADPEKYLSELRDRARGIPDPCRIAVVLGLITEEGLPHFHRQIAVYLGDTSFWQEWNNLWTAEEDRHGVVLHDYCRITRILHVQSLEKLQFDYLRRGFLPQWERDPYRLFVYTSLQERATQLSHLQTGKAAENYEPQLGYILYRVAGDEARHCSFYRRVFAEILQRDPDRALESALRIIPRIDMPGTNMPNFSEYAEVVQRAGIYGPREYLRIVIESLKSWGIESLTGLGEAGRRAQEKILAVPKRLEKVCDRMESRTTAKSFSFDIVYGREFEA